MLTALDKLRRIYDVLGDDYRAAAYKKAQESLANYNGNYSMEELLGLDGVGRGIASKVIEFRRTGRIEKLEELRKDPKIVAWKLFSGVLGAGPETLKKWIEMGLKTLADLKTAAATGKITITKTIRLGIKYYSDLIGRIPRAEVAAIGAQICKIGAGIGALSSCELVGSYRRGAAESGDVDVLICGRMTDFLAKLKQRLADEGNCIDILSCGKEKMTLLWQYDGAGGTTRQVDIMYVAPTNYYAALSYFTGSYSHNTRLRGLAKRAGMKLNQNGLYKKDKNGAWSPIPLRSEKDIYAAIGVDYIAPSSRG